MQSMNSEYGSHHFHIPCEFGSFKSSKKYKKDKPFLNSCFKGNNFTGFFMTKLRHQTMLYNITAGYIFHVAYSEIVDLELQTCLL